ncbi:MAG TPA: nucleotidyltransferase domain-containing protein [Opitutaceae bacterium]|jgi:predicted nucleotidyltransferase|nr:nucleotidyltransferase domain-containing protein [Opitutaceae bacterium]
MSGAVDAEADWCGFGDFTITPRKALRPLRCAGGDRIFELRNRTGGRVRRGIASFCFSIANFYPQSSIGRMVPVAQIRAYAREVARRFKPEKIILFGSYAYGHPKADSDVDLLVVMSHSGRPPYQEAKIRTAVRAPFPVDLMVRTPKRLRERLAMNDSFLSEIVHKGRVLHET